MDKKISELDQALQINNDAVFPFSQDNSGEDTTYKASITQIGAEVGEDQTFSNLQTSSKKLVGAINELLSLGNPIILGTSAPTSSQGADGNIYVQYTAGTGGADDEVDGIYVKIDGAWCEIQTGGGAGGHTIIDDGGTSLAQRTNLQFLGAYSEDNSTDDTTEVNIVREMTKAEFDELPEEEKVGFINITDITSGNDDRFQPVIFSEDEREIGVWIDGKPLYEKTIDCGYLPNNTTKDVAHNISNIDTVAQAWAIVNRKSTTPKVYMVLPYVVTDSQWDINFNITDTNVHLDTYADRTNCYVYTVIRYTKTTDQAGSGQWTPQGVPTHHYSTDEQVIGTWIDGSTLYERVFDLGSDVSIANDTLTDTTIDASNMSKIIYAVGQYSTGVTLYPLMSNINNNLIRLQSDRNGNVGASVRYVILQYTKSV